MKNTWKIREKYVIRYPDVAHHVLTFSTNDALQRRHALWRHVSINLQHKSDSWFYDSFCSLSFDSLINFVILKTRKVQEEHTLQTALRIRWTADSRRQSPPGALRRDVYHFWILQVRREWTRCAGVLVYPLPINHSKILLTLLTACRQVRLVA